MLYRFFRCSLMCLSVVVVVVSCAAPKKELPVTDGSVVVEEALPAEQLPPEKKKGFFARVFGPQPKKEKKQQMLSSLPAPAPVPAVQELPPEPKPEKKGFFAWLFGPKAKKAEAVPEEAFPAPQAFAEKPAGSVPVDSLPDAAAGEISRPARKSALSDAGDGFRMPDMLTMPEERDLKKSSGASETGEGSVIAKPPVAPKQE